MDYYMYVDCILLNYNVIILPQSQLMTSLPVPPQTNLSPLVYFQWRPRPLPKPRPPVRWMTSTGYEEYHSDHAPLPRGSAPFRTAGSCVFSLDMSGLGDCCTTTLTWVTFASWVFTLFNRYVKFGIEIESDWPQIESDWPRAKMYWIWS